MHQPRLVTSEKGSLDIAVNVLTNRLYLMNNSGSEISTFSGASGKFPVPLLDELTGAANAVR